VGLPLGAYRFLSPREIKFLELLVAKEPEEEKRTPRRSTARSKQLRAKP